MVLKMYVLFDGHPIAKYLRVFILHFSSFGREQCITCDVSPPHPDVSRNKVSHVYSVTKRTLQCLHCRTNRFTGSEHRGRNKRGSGGTTTPPPKKKTISRFTRVLYRKSFCFEFGNFSVPKTSFQLPALKTWNAYAYT